MGGVVLGDCVCCGIEVVIEIYWVCGLENFKIL